MSTSKGDQSSVVLKTALRSRDQVVRFNAGLDLVKLGDLDGVPALIEGLGHQSQALRNFHAGNALISLGHKAVPALSAALGSGNILVRTAAANILHQIDGTLADELLPVALAALEVDDLEAKADAYALLGRIGEKASTATPKLTAVLQIPTKLTDPHAWERDPRVGVVGLLAQIGSPLDETISALMEALGSGADSLRWSAAQALGTMGPKARPSASALSRVALNEDEVETVRVEAAYSLVKVGDDAIDLAPALRDLLSSSSWWVRAFAARIFGEPTLRPRGDSDGRAVWSPGVLSLALPALANALADSDFIPRTTRCWRSSGDMSFSA